MISVFYPHGGLIDDFFKETNSAHRLKFVSSENWGWLSITPNINWIFQSIFNWRDWDNHSFFHENETVIFSLFEKHSIYACMKLTGSFKLDCSLDKC
jgi:hypothetical protein